MSQECTIWAFGASIVSKLNEIINVARKNLSTETQILQEKTSISTICENKRITRQLVALFFDRTKHSSD